MIKKKIYNDFMMGLSAVGLARKYGKKVKEIEEIIRRRGR